MNTPGRGHDDGPILQYPVQFGFDSVLRTWTSNQDQIGGEASASVERAQKTSTTTSSLYQLFARIYELQKNLYVYKVFAQYLASLSEGYARKSLDFPPDEWKDGSRPVEIRRWYQTYCGQLEEWTTYDLLHSVLRRDRVKSSLLRIFRQIPPELYRETSKKLKAKYDAVDIENLGCGATADALRMVLSSREELKVAIRLRGEDAQSFIDLLDQTMENKPDDRLHTQCLHALRKLCGRSATLPSSCVLSRGLEKTSEGPLMSGGFADIWLGKYNGMDVALKVLRVYGSANLEAVKMSFCREAVLWKRLRHPNILPFLGVSTSLFPLCMVSKWMSNGNIVNYITKNPSVNRLELLVGVAQGLQHLHTIGVLHGDLKGANILIDDALNACLSDFGLTAVTYDPNTVNAITTSSTVLGSIRWMAPEMIHPEESTGEKCQASAESDIYALAMVIWEVFSGKVPFFEYPRDATVVFKITLGIRPERPFEALPIGLSDIVWSMIEMCWQAEWRKRPRVPFVLQCLEEAVRQFVPPSEDQALQTFQYEDSSSEDIFPDDSSDEGDDLSFQVDYTVPRTEEHHSPFQIPISPPSILSEAHSQFSDPGVHITGSSDLSIALDNVLKDDARTPTDPKPLWDEISSADSWY